MSSGTCLSFLSSTFSQLEPELARLSARLFLCRRCEVNGVTGKDGKADDESYNEDNPSPTGKPVGKAPVGDAKSEDDGEENIEATESAPYDLNGLPAFGECAGDEGKDSELSAGLMSEFEHGESRALVGIGPATGFMAELGAEELLSSSEMASCLGGVLRGEGGSDWNNL